MSFLSGLSTAIRRITSPKPPSEPQGLATAASESAALGRESLAFQKQVYQEEKVRQKELDALTGQVVRSYLDAQARETGRSDEYYNYMKSTFRPIEQSLAKE